MKIERAIEVLIKWREEESVDDEAELHEAEQLGIEALKRLKEHREDQMDITYRALPGETR